MTEIQTNFLLVIWIDNVFVSEIGILAGITKLSDHLLLDLELVAKKDFLGNSTQFKHLFRTLTWMIFQLLECAVIVLQIQGDAAQSLSLLCRSTMSVCLVCLIFKQIFDILIHALFTCFRVTETIKKFEIQNYIEQWIMYVHIRVRFPRNSQRKNFQ